MKMLLTGKSMQDPSYTPVRLINETAYKLGARSDSHLCSIINVHCAQLSRVRHRTQFVSCFMIISIMDRTGWSLAYVRELAGVPFEEL